MDSQQNCLFEVINQILTSFSKEIKLSIRINPNGPSFVSLHVHYQCKFAKLWATRLMKEFGIELFVYVLFWAQVLNQFNIYIKKKLKKKKLLLISL